MRKNFIVLLSFLSVFTLLFSVSLNDIYADKKSNNLKSDYDDLYNGDWEIEYADWGVDRGVISVYDDNTVRVNESLMEYELMMMVARYVGLSGDYEDKEEELYDDLRNIGIMSSGTMNKDKRREVSSVEEGLFISLTIHDDEKYKNRKDKIREALKIINDDKDIENLKLETELKKVDVLRILKSYESLGSEIITGKPESKVGNNWREIYFGDEINKRISYLEKDSGLLINIIELDENYLSSKETIDYYKDISEDNLEEYKKGKYIINVRNVGSKPLDLVGFSLLIKDGKPLKAYETDKSIGLNGKSSVNYVIEGDNITELKVIIGDTVKDVNLSQFNKFKNKSMFITDDETGKIKYNQFYLTDDLKDVDYVLEYALSKEYN